MLCNVIMPVFSLTAEAINIFILSQLEGTRSNWCSSKNMTSVKKKIEREQNETLSRKKTPISKF